MMMRCRTIKPDFFTHEGLFDAEKETGLPLRVAFAGTWGCADREGRFQWRPKAMGAVILPYDEIDFSRVLDALVTRGFLVKYAIKNEWYGCIPSFRRHQFVNNREAKSILPDVKDAEEVIDASSTRGISREPRVDDAMSARLMKEVTGSEVKKNYVENANGSISTGSLFENPEKPAKEKAPRKPKERKQLNGYNPVAIWILAVQGFCKIPEARVTGYESKLLTELGNIYPEREFRAMLRAYGKDHDENGKPWKLFEEFYKCHSHWRSKARVGIDPGSEQALQHVLAGGDLSELNINRPSGGNQESNGSSGGIPS